MTGYLTTHILGTARGCPAAGIPITLYRLDEGRTQVAQAITNSDGRTDSPILPTDAFATGRYELIFHCGDYLRSCGIEADPLFLEDIPIRFAMAEEDHYHVPLLLSPYGYSTYRGS